MLSNESSADATLFLPGVSLHFPAGCMAVDLWKTDAARRLAA
jgi:hypothetical protein